MLMPCVHYVLISMATGGPLSISRELSQLYNFDGVKEVNVRLVEQEEVGIDLLELKFKVQSTILDVSVHHGHVYMLPRVPLLVGRQSGCFFPPYTGIDHRERSFGQRWSSTPLC